MARSPIEGVTALRKKLNEMAALADSDTRQRVSAQLTAQVDDVAKQARDGIRQTARSVGWPRRLERTIFKFSDLKKDELPKTVRAALVGVRKGAPPRLDTEIYKEWNAGNSKSPKAKRAIGTKIGMSLAAMFEFGTSKLQARPAFRRTYQAMRSGLRLRLIDVFRKAVEEFNK